MEALDTALIDAHEYVQRMDESFPRYEQDSEAPSAFPRAMRFLTETIIPDYCEEGTALKYEIPSWMENM